jgi:hypothetical protein
MNDLVTMMRDQARAGLQTQLEAAVTEGNVEAVRKITADIEKLAIQTAPKAPPYGDVEIRAELSKLDWFGVDPKKSAKAVEFGKTMDPKKFGTAEAFTAAIVKAIDEEFKPAVEPKKEDPPEDEPDEDDPEEEPEPKKARRTDGPGPTDSTTRTRRITGPWAKLSDAPKEVQTEIKRSVDKFLSTNAPKEQRETFISKALESHYAVHQRKQGKK